MKIFFFLIAMSLFSCGEKPSQNISNKNEKISITVKLQGEHLRFRQFDKNYVQVAKGVSWKDVSLSVNELLEFEEKWEMGNCYVDGKTEAIDGSYIFNESKLVIVSAKEEVSGITMWEKDDMVSLKIKGEVSYEIGFVDPVYGYIKERNIKRSFAISKYEVLKMKMVRKKLKAIFCETLQKA